MKRIILFIIFIYLTACSTTPVFEKFPRHRVDRPYTLPEGMTSWRGELGYANDGAPNYFGYPLFWDQASSDDWNITWSPFPLDIHYQILKDEDRVLGTSLNLMGPAYSRQKDFLWKPSLTFYFRNKFSPNSAIESGLGYQLEMGGPQHGEAVSWTTTIWAGPLFQLNENIALGPRLYFFIEKGNPFGPYLNVGKPRVGDADVNLRFPVGVFASAWLSRQWEVISCYQYFGLGYRGYESHQIFLDLVFYW
jgi:hypothetical protein